MAASAYISRSAGLPAAQDPSRIIRSLGRIYTSLYCIDLTDGTFAELSSVSVIHSHIGARGDAQERLNYFCHHLVAPEGRGDMLAFVDLSTLDGRLGDGRIISRQYRSTLFAAPEGEGAQSWRECSFIECGRDGAGRLTHVIFATKSIHETKARELEAQQRLQETNRELTALLAAQTQHTAIIGMTAIAAAHIDDRDRVQDSLQKITQASKHLLSLINEVLDMSKIESGKVDLVEEEFNLSELIDNLLTMTSSQIEAHRHALCVNISDVAHEAVVGDSLRIQKVFANLMSNAVKYTPDGGRIRLTISEKPCAQAVDRMAEIGDGYYDMIFMDIQMPGMNGYDATRAICAMDRPYCKRIPIIAMTANAFAEDVQAARTVGMNEHIAKPLDLGTLTRTLRRWL